ncbi:MAG: sulfate permease [Gammaproteobacteria bacterium]|nr:sulfate permease [Gammaproteobacteria bacterium]
MSGVFTPFLGWIGELRKGETLKVDVMAGITVALVLVPQSMAYAQLAGLPPYYGLYASFLPPMIAAIFGSSRQLATGPVAVVSLLTAASLEPLAAAGSEGFLAYAILLAILVGLFQIALGLLKLGIVVDLLSHPVVVGFTNAGAIIIATSQLSKLFGVTAEKGEHQYETVMNVVQAAMASPHWATVWIAVLAITIMVGLKKFKPKWPNVLVAVAVTTVLSWLTGFQEQAGGAVVGTIPDGLPAIGIPAFDMDIIGQLMASAIIISLIGFMEAIAIAKAMAARTRQRLDINQELVGQGLSNIVSGLSSGYPVSGSFSRSAVNIEAGAITGFSSIVTGIVVGITLLFLTPLLYHLPTATLGAVIIMAVVGLVKVKPVIHAWHAQRSDAVVSVITFGLTLYLAPHLEWGIVTGVILSMLLFVFRFMRPRMAEVSRFKDGSMRDVKVHPLPVSPEIAIVRLDSSLYFGNAGYFEGKILKVVASHGEALKYIILDAEGINEIDATGEDVLANLVRRLRLNGVEIYVARMKKQFMDTIRKTKLLEVMGRDHFFARVETALNRVWDDLGDEYDRENCPLNLEYAARMAKEAEKTA